MTTFLQKRKAKRNPSFALDLVLQERDSYTVSWDEDKTAPVWDALVEREMPLDEKVAVARNLLNYDISDDLMSFNAVYKAWDKVFEKELAKRTEEVKAKLEKENINSGTVLNCMIKKSKRAYFGGLKENEVVLKELFLQNVLFKDLKEKTKEIIFNLEIAPANQYIDDVLYYLPKNRQALIANKNQDDRVDALGTTIALLVPGYLSRKDKASSVGSGENIKIADTSFSWPLVREDWRAWDINRSERGRVPRYLQQPYQPENNIIYFMGNLYNLKEKQIALVIEDTAKQL